MAFRKHSALDSGLFRGPSAPAVLHTNFAGGAHMKPCFKAILDGYRGDIEVIAKALKAKVSLFFHGSIMWGDLVN